MDEKERMIRNIGRGQTISQQYIAAYMAQSLDLHPEDNVLEVGSRCGNNAALLSRLVSHVYRVEIIEWLEELAEKNLAKADIPNVSIHFSDGYQCWPESKAAGYNNKFLFSHEL